MNAKTRYYTKIRQLDHLTEHEEEELETVARKYAFRCSDYYAQLIDWSDPDDPIRRIAIPNPEELDDWGRLDASSEEIYTAAPGLEHKYEDTALLLVNDVCGSFCRFCFRKRLFMNGNREVTRDPSEALRYIQRHREINNVLLTGGDPLLLSSGRIEAIFSRLREIPHVRIVRLGTKMPAFNPDRILNDPELPKTIERWTELDRRVYVMVHFNHPRELTAKASKALLLLQRAGAITANQTPLLRGVNDDPEVLGELFDALSFRGVPPYYVFQCRPTEGNHMFSVPIEEGYETFVAAQSRGAGLAKRARFAMSHATGKIMICGMDRDFVYMQYHRSAVPELTGRFFRLQRNPDARWLEDYEEIRRVEEAHHDDLPELASA